MNKILVCSHGRLAEGIVNSLNIIMGNTKGIEYISFYEEGEGAGELKKISDYLEKNKDNNLIILTDLFGGSVNQEVMKMESIYNNFRIITGMNFPLLLELSIVLENGISDEELEEIVNRSKDQLIIVKKTSKTEFNDDFDF